jgi:hypothetical protein
MTGKEAAGVINNVVGALKNNPALLAILVLNAMIGAYVVHSDNQETLREEQREKNRAAYIEKILRSCLPRGNG